MAKPSYYSLCKNGTHCPDVALIQTWINEIAAMVGGLDTPLKVDGIFGAKTEAAVKAFQTWKKLAVDGKVGIKTWNSLYNSYVDYYGEGEQYPGVLIRQGQHAAVVRSAQQRLSNKGFGLTSDGIFGSKTLAAVKGFQKKKGLNADGIIGPKTWAALYN